jgi:ketosteroid isomerase-like protein
MRMIEVQHSQEPTIDGGAMNGFASRCGVLLLVGVAIGAIAERPSYSQSSGGDEKTLLKLQHDWAEARKKSDMAFLENFYGSEFTVGNMNGFESSRAEDLAMFSSGDMKPAIITDSELKVAIYGQAAMVTGIEHLEGTYKGHPGQFDLRFTNVFVNRDRRWQLVRHQSTPLSKR